MRQVLESEAPSGQWVTKGQTAEVLTFTLFHLLPFKLQGEQCSEYQPCRAVSQKSEKHQHNYNHGHSFEELIGSSLPHNRYFCFVAEVQNEIETSHNTLYCAE